MQAWHDYYRILQVHNLAEPEVIESAYKRLARKYHPDTNKSKDAEFRMKLINEAYDVLKDTGKRKRYNDDWLKRQRFTNFEKAPPQSAPENEPEEDNIPARQAVSSYFDGIKSGDLKSAYEMITASDKKNIPRDDFYAWQSSVAKVYHLQEFTCIFKKETDACLRGGAAYFRSAVFTVTTVEYNAVMGRTEKDIVEKTAVLENTGWHILIGYSDVKPFIAKFEELAGLLEAKSAINDMVEFYANIDGPTGLMNKKGFIDAAEKEIWRHERYGNPFTMMLLTFNCIAASKLGGRESTAATVEWAGKIIRKNFRKIDILGRWGETEFMILMPETRLSRGVRAAQKIKGVIEAEKCPFGKPVFNIGLDEYRESLEKTLSRLGHCVSVGEARGGNYIVCRRKIYG